MKSGLPQVFVRIWMGLQERSKIRVDLELPDDLGRLPQDLETAIFRIVRMPHEHSPSFWKPGRQNSYWPL